VAATENKPCAEQVPHNIGRRRDWANKTKKPDSAIINVAAEANEAYKKEPDIQAHERRKKPHCHVEIAAALDG